MKRGYRELSFKERVEDFYWEFIYGLIPKGSLWELALVLVGLGILIYLIRH